MSLRSQKSGFNVEGIRFEDVPLGGRELKVVWRDLSDYVRLEVVAGVPTTISLVDWDDDEGVSGATWRRKYVTSKIIVIIFLEYPVDIVIKKC